MAHNKLQHIHITAARDGHQCSIRNRWVAQALSRNHDALVAPKTLSLLHIFQINMMKPGYQGFLASDSSARLSGGLETSCSHKLRLDWAHNRWQSTVCWRSYDSKALVTLICCTTVKRWPFMQSPADLCATNFVEKAIFVRICVHIILVFSVKHVDFQDFQG